MVAITDSGPRSDFGCLRRCGTSEAVWLDHWRVPRSRFFRHSITLSILTPSMLRGLLAAIGPGPRRDDYEILVTSGFLPIALAEEAADRITGRIGIAYGSTELATPPLLSRSMESLYWL